MNPAFAGSSHCLRAMAHQRLQWPFLDAKYITSYFSADYFLKKTNTGAGLIFYKDWQGANHINSTDAAFQLSQEVNLSSKWSARAGVQVDYVSRYLNYAKLTFPDQFNNNGPTGGNTQEPENNDRANYLDFSLGGMLYSDNFWLGVAANHINTPEQRFTNGVSSKLPSKIDIISGYKIFIEKKQKAGKMEQGRDIYFTPTMHYKFQGKSDQVDFGIYGLYDHLMLGFWYRGIPLLKRYRRGLQNSESVVFLAGWRVNNLSISYSYDFTVSILATSNTGGSHELNLTYVYCLPPKKKKRMKRLPCPHFYG